MSDLSEVKNLIDAQGAAWEEFKKVNDDRLVKLEKGLATGDEEAKLAKINTKLDEVAAEAKAAYAKANKTATFGEGDAKSIAAEVKSFNDALYAHSTRLSRPVPAALDADQYAAYKSGVQTWLRKGTEGLSDAERKAINVGTDPEGGYLTTSEMDGMIDRVVAKQSAFRQLARVVTIGSSSYEKLVKTSGASAGGWGGETTAPTETGTPGWVKLEFVPGMVWAEPRATSQSLEDAVFNVEGDLIDEIGITFADQEAQAFIDGSGVNRPKGFLSYTNVINSSYAWGGLGWTVTGGAASFAASNPSDALIDLQHSLKRNYRGNANWIMNDATLGAVRKFKDGNGIYLWAPSSLMGGIVGQLLGHGVVTDDYMPDLGSNTYPVAFGDFQRGYLIVDRRGTTILRDPYTAKPYVKFFATRRVGGGITNFEAIKILKCST
jgi:HK97 family phage major capsid protein